MRAPRRPGTPAKQRNSPGSGPAGPENFGYFPSLESSPPAGGTSPKTKPRFRPAGRVPFAAMQKETKNRRVTWLLGKTCGSRLGLSGARPTPSVPSGHLPLTGGVGPRTPILRESTFESLALAAGAVLSGKVSERYHCRSPQWTGPPASTG